MKLHYAELEWTLRGFFISVDAELTPLTKLLVFEIGISGMCRTGSESSGCDVQMSKLHLPMTCCMVASGRSTT